MAPRSSCTCIVFVLCTSLFQPVSIGQDDERPKNPPALAQTDRDDRQVSQGQRGTEVPDVDQMLLEAGGGFTTNRSPTSDAIAPSRAESEGPWSKFVRVLDILKFPFLACLVLTGIHCYLGIHVISRGVIFVDLALAQMAALGGIIALLVGLEPHGENAYSLEAWLAYGISLTTTLLGAALFATGRLRKQVVPQEAIIGIIYAVSSALALLLLSKSPVQHAETSHMLVGRILFVGGDEVLKTTALYAAVGLFHWIFRRQFLTISLHPDLAHEQGMSVRWWDFLFYTSFGVVVTSSVHMAGVLLVFSFLIVPAVCATLLARNIGTRLLIGWGVGLAASVLGLYFSVQFGLPPGESVVSTFGGLLILVALVRMFRRGPATGSIPIHSGG